MTRITEDQLRKAGPEGTALYKQAKEMFEQNKVSLAARFAKAGREGRISEAVAQQMIAAVDGILFRLVKPEPVLTEGGKRTSSIILDYPDELLDFLTSAECPKELQSELAGAIIIEKKELDA